MSWKRKYSVELQRRREDRKAVKAALQKTVEDEANEAIGYTPRPDLRTLKPGTPVGHKKTGSVELIDILTDNKPTIRRYTRGKSKYYPAAEERKRAKEIASGRVERLGRFTRRFRGRRHLDAGTGGELLAPLSSPVEGG